MLASRLWRLGRIRRLSQNSVVPRFSAEETRTTPPHRDGFFNLGFGRTYLHKESHEYLPPKSLHREVLFAESGRTRRGCVNVCSECNRRSLCTSEAGVFKDSVRCENREDAALPRNHGLPSWKGNVKSSQEDANMYSYVESARRYGPLVSQHNADIADGFNDPPMLHQRGMGSCDTRKTSMSVSNTSSVGKEDAQSCSRPRGDTMFGSLGNCPSFERLDDYDDEDTEENSRVWLHWDKEDSRVVLSIQEKKTVKDICSLLDGGGWTAYTKETLEEHFCVHLSQAVVTRVILRQKNKALASFFFQWACEYMGHDLCLYHAYLTMLGETKQFDEMWGFLTVMKDVGLEVNGFTFCIIIRACGAAGMPAVAVDAFKRVVEYGIALDIHLYCTLLNTFFVSNMVEEARLCYSIMVKENLTFDTGTYYILIRGFRLSSDVEDAKRSFDIMLKEGVEPDVLTYNALIAAYCNVRAMDKATSAFSDLQKRGLKPSVSTVNLLIDAFCKRGSFDDAMNILVSIRTLSPPHQSSFNILLHGLLSGKQISKALKFFLIMEKGGVTNKWTYIHLSNGLRQVEQTGKIQRLLKDLFAKHGYGNTEVCVALLYNLCHSGELRAAESLFEGMLASSMEPSMPAYAIMISFYCRLEMLDKALQIFSEVKRWGWRPSVFCYTPIVGALLKVNRAADAMKCFQEMMEYGYEVNAVTCDFLLRELCKHGMVEHVTEVLNTVLDNKFPIRGPTFIELMKCFSKVGKIEEANTLFRFMYELGCLPLEKAAALQALSVMDIMSCPSNEKD